MRPGHAHGAAPRLARRTLVGDFPCWRPRRAGRRWPDADLAAGHLTATARLRLPASPASHRPFLPTVTRGNRRPTAILANRSADYARLAGGGVRRGWRAHNSQLCERLKWSADRKRLAADRGRRALARARALPASCSSRRFVVAWPSWTRARSEATEPDWPSARKEAKGIFVPGTGLGGYPRPWPSCGHRTATAGSTCASQSGSRTPAARTRLWTSRFLYPISTGRRQEPLGR